MPKPIHSGWKRKVIITEAYPQLLPTGLFKYVQPFFTMCHERSQFSRRVLLKRYLANVEQV